jgi:hypothetical protein
MPPVTPANAQVVVASKGAGLDAALHPQVVVVDEDAGFDAGLGLHGSLLFMVRVLDSWTKLATPALSPQFPNQQRYYLERPPTSTATAILASQERG